jgi:hypothetical protein
LRIKGSTIEEEEDLGEINMADPETVRMFRGGPTRRRVLGPWIFLHLR